jgi:hypothetical protein
MMLGYSLRGFHWVVVSFEKAELNQRAESPQPGSCAAHTVQPNLQTTASAASRHRLVDVYAWPRQSPGCVPTASAGMAAANLLDQRVKARLVTAGHTCQLFLNGRALKRSYHRETRSVKQGVLLRFVRGREQQRRSSGQCARAFLFPGSSSTAAPTRVASLPACFGLAVALQQRLS